MKKTLKTLLIISVFYFSAGCDSRELKIVKETRFLMGTLFDITVSHPDVKEARKAIEDAFDEIRRIEELTSTFIPKSEVAKINQQAGAGPVSVSEELYSLLKDSVENSKLTEGAFDISVGVIQKLWNFDDENGTVPTEEDIGRLLPLVGFKKILLGENREVSLKSKGMKLDLGAIAKGYAVDRGIDILKKHNIQNAILNGGGDLKSIGGKVPGSPWKIGVRHPRKPESVIATFAGKNNAAATSGDYQKYFVKDGIRYHHILDPATGMQATGLRSVTIITDDAAFADAMATAVFVMGAERGFKFIESESRLEGLLITYQGEIIISSGLNDGEIEIHGHNERG